MAHLKVVPLSSKLEEGLATEPPSSSAPIGDYKVGRQAPRGLGCIAEVSPRVAKWAYFIGFTISSIVSWIARDYSDKIFKHIKGLDACLGIQSDGSETGVGECVGKGAVLRISFGTFLFFAIHFVGVLGVTKAGNKRRLVHTGIWPVQLALWLALVFVCFFSPNSVYSGYAQVCKVCGGLFLVLVVIIFVDWFYMLNEWLLARTDKLYAKLTLVFGSLCCYVGSLIALGFMFNSYAPKASCGTNIAFLSLTIIGAVIYTALSVSPWRPSSAGLFTSGTIFLYCTYLCWGALSSQPAGDCVPANASSLPIQIIGFIIAIGSVLFASWDTASQDKAFLRDVERLDEEQVAKEDLPYNLAWFHGTFMLASAYMAMVLTNWTLSNGPNPWSVDKGGFSSWVRIASQWLCGCFYTWTLIAPLVLRKRVFD